MRIAKAVREGRWGKVKSLQWLLTHSFAAKLLAVRRVTQNAGRKTAGVDIAGRAAGSPIGVFVRLEPYAGKLARTVLRGGWTSNGSSLPDD
jgi:hypothetical protein